MIWRTCYDANGLVCVCSPTHVVVRLVFDDAICEVAAIFWKHCLLGNRTRARNLASQAFPIGPRSLFFRTNTWFNFTQLVFFEKSLYKLLFCVGNCCRQPRIIAAQTLFPIWNFCLIYPNWRKLQEVCYFFNIAVSFRKTGFSFWAPYQFLTLHLVPRSTIVLLSLSSTRLINSSVTLPASH